MLAKTTTKVITNWEDKFDSLKEERCLGVIISSNLKVAK